MIKKIIQIILCGVYFFGYQLSECNPSSEKRSRLMVAKFQIEHLETAINCLYDDIKRYPTTEEGLELLLKSSGKEINWNGPYLKKKIPFDPWGKQFIYYFPPKYGCKIFDIYSFGQNGQDNFGKYDDLTNWKEINYKSDDMKNRNFVLSCTIFIIIIASYYAVLRKGESSLNAIASRFARFFSLMTITGIIIAFIGHELFALSTFLGGILCLLASIFLSILALAMKRVKKIE